MKNEFINFPSMKLKVIPNAYDSFFDKIKFSISNTKTKNILYLSNLMESKGITYFLKAIENLLEIYKDLNVTIAGKFLGDHLKSKKQIEKRILLFIQ